jgi:hypothetical protein
MVLSERPLEPSGSGGFSLSGPRQTSRRPNPHEEISWIARREGSKHLIRWTGACAPAGDARTCTVTVVEAKTVSAVFGHVVEVVPRPEASIRVASGLAQRMVGI